ncbi:MAG: hypothetical protein ABH983_04955 [Candidatus Micrarchaeota archaeon]
MCHYFDIIGSGEVLILQLLVLSSIIISIIIWIKLYLQNGLEKELWTYAPAIIFWIVFGTLDILVTAKGTFLDPYREGNPLARFIFVESGYLGPVIASILWISLWAGIVLLINKAKINGAAFFSCAIFWSLAVGHLFGFSSWFIPMCAISENYRLFFSEVPRVIKIILIGMVIAIFQYSGVKKIN